MQVVGVTSQLQSPETRRSRRVVENLAFDGYLGTAEIMARDFAVHNVLAKQVSALIECLWRETPSFRAKTLGQKQNRERIFVAWKSKFRRYGEK